MRLLRRGCYRDLFQLLVMGVVIYFLRAGLIETLEPQSDIYEDDKNDEHKKMEEDIKNIVAVFDDGDVAKVDAGSHGKDVINDGVDGNDDMDAINDDDVIIYRDEGDDVFDVNANDAVHIDNAGDAAVVDNKGNNADAMVDNKGIDAKDVDNDVAPVDVPEEKVALVKKILQPPVDAYIEKRDPLCKKTMLSNRIEPATLIVPFCDEPLHDLLQLLRSIKENTKKRLVYEIVYLRGKCKAPLPLLDIEIALEAEYDEVILARAGDEIGTMQARRRASQYTAASNLVFLDVGCRLTPNWLPPLLEILQIHNKTIAAPLVEILDPTSGKYTVPLNETRTGFDWYLRPRNMPLQEESKKNLPLPYLSPMLPSSVFAVDKKFFQNLGTHDPGINSWGPAQLELSLKSWLCGGNIAVVPCSRVLFQHSSVNTYDSVDPLGYRRVLEVWMSKEYRRQIFKRRKDLLLLEPGDVDSVAKTKMNLKCKDLDWYLNYVSPYVTKVFPIIQPPHYANGKITSMQYDDYCVTSDGGAGTEIILARCGQGKVQVWLLDWRKVVRTSNELYCWTVGVKRGVGDDKADKPTLQDCLLSETVPSTQSWRYNPSSHQVQDGWSKRCLTVASDSTSLKLEECDIKKWEQKWKFEIINYDLISKNFPNL